MASLQDDIIRYKRGELSPKEMHALEMRALNDPFLAEALEGTGNISPLNFSKDVEELNQKITGKRKEILFTPLRIAAGLILISASMYLFYSLMPKPENIALNTEKPKEPGPASKAEPAEPKIELKEKEKTIDQQKAPTGEKVLTQKEKPKREREMHAAGGETLSEEKTKPKIESQPIVAEQKEIAGPEKKSGAEKLDRQVSLSEKESSGIDTLKEIVVTSKGLTRQAKELGYSVSNVGKTMPAKTKITSISGKVISAEDGSALPGVNVVIKGTSIGTVTDADGFFTLNGVTENQQLVFSFIGMQTEEINNEGKDKLDVTMKVDATQLSEVVITVVGVRRDEDESPIINLASPVGGKKAYNKYLDVNARYPEEAQKNNIKGKVRVEFTVHTDGSFDQYKVVKSLGSGCDEEVIRLIKEGPKWLPTTENGKAVESTVRIGVKFDPSMTGR